MRVPFPPCMHLTHLPELSLRSFQCPSGLVPGQRVKTWPQFSTHVQSHRENPWVWVTFGDQQGLRWPSPAERRVLKKHTEAKSCPPVSFGQRARGPVDPARVFGGWDGLCLRHRWGRRRPHWSRGMSAPSQGRLFYYLEFSLTRLTFLDLHILWKGSSKLLL